MQHRHLWNLFEFELIDVEDRVDDEVVQQFQSNGIVSIIKSDDESLDTSNRDYVDPNEFDNAIGESTPDNVQEYENDIGGDGNDGEDIDGDDIIEEKDNMEIDESIDNDLDN